VARKLIVFDCEGAKVLEVSDLAQLDKLVKGRAAIAIIEGDVVALGTLELRGGEGAKVAADPDRGPGCSSPAKGGRGAVKEGHSRAGPDVQGVLR